MRMPGRGEEPQNGDDPITTHGFEFGDHRSNVGFGELQQRGADGLVLPLLADYLGHMSAELDNRLAGERGLAAGDDKPAAFQAARAQHNVLDPKGLRSGSHSVPWPVLSIGYTEIHADGMPRSRLPRSRGGRQSNTLLQGALR
jgi:hypothetical protein